MSTRPEPSSLGRGGHARAARALQEARETIDQMADRELPDSRMVILDILATAERALALTECRQAKPFAEIIQIGTGSGLHYECTHTPPHRY